MTNKTPQVTHMYQNHHLDSTRWDRFFPREGDIVVATPYKSGTTCMRYRHGWTCASGLSMTLSAS